MTCAQEACPILNMHCKLCFSAARAVCRWAYEQVAEALCKLYKDPHGRVGQHLHHGSPRAGCPGALADALLALAQGLASAHTDIRYALHLLCGHPHLPGSPPPPFVLVTSCPQCLLGHLADGRPPGCLLIISHPCLPDLPPASSQQRC